MAGELVPREHDLELVVGGERLLALGADLAATAGGWAIMTIGTDPMILEFAPKILRSTSKILMTFLKWY